MKLFFTISGSTHNVNLFIAFKLFNRVRTTLLLQNEKSMDVSVKITALFRNSSVINNT